MVTSIMSIGRSYFGLCALLRACFRVELRQMRFLFPPAAKGFVKADKVLPDGALAAGEVVLNRKQGALRFQNVQEVNQPTAIPFVGQFHCAAIGRLRFDQRAMVLLFLAEGDQSVLYFLERRQDRLFVANEGLRLPRILDFNVLADASAGKYRPAQARPKRPEPAAAALKKVAHAAAL